ncbi:MAG: hypothetical protein ACRDL6_05405 [Solirubrobacterales bacterium]
MSRDELVNAYLEGGVSRRTFIRRLVGAGVTLGAAVSYAHLLSPERAGAQTANPDFYRAPQVSLDVASKSGPALVKNGAVEVFISVQESAQIQLTAVATAAAGGAGAAAAKRKRKKAKPRTVASLVVDFPAGGQQLIKMPLNRAGRKLFKRARKAKVLVSATATDRQGAVTAVSAERTVKGAKKKKRK